MEQQLLELMTFLQSLPIWLVCLFLAGMALLQYVFPPAPSDTLLVVLGILTVLDVFVGAEVFFAYTLASVLGSIGLYELALFLGEKILRLKWIQRLIDVEKLPNSRKKIEKYGGISYFLLRFVPGMQCVTLISFGLVRLKRASAYWNMILVGFLSSAVYFFLGYFLGENMPRLVSLLDTMGVFGKILLALLIVLIVIFAIYWKIFRKKEK